MANDQPESSVPTRISNGPLSLFPGDVLSLVRCLPNARSAGIAMAWAFHSATLGDGWLPTDYGFLAMIAPRDTTEAHAKAAKEALLAMGALEYFNPEMTFRFKIVAASAERAGRLSSAAKTRASRRWSKDVVVDAPCNAASHCGDALRERIPAPQSGAAMQYTAQHSLAQHSLADSKPRKSKPTAGEGAAFTAFWSAYPKRKSRGQAEATWAKIAPDAALVAQIVAGAKRLANDADACRERGKFVPHPSTWLNAKGWLDEPTRLPHALDEPEDFYKNFDDMYPEDKA